MKGYAHRMRIASGGLQRPQLGPHSIKIDTQRRFLLRASGIPDIS
jgi:hypothetical protein